MYTQFKEIIVKIENRIATVIFNRPALGNAFALDSYLEVKEAMIRLGADDQVGAIILTGAGKNFSAGGDINRFKQLIESKEYLNGDNVAKTADMGMAIRRCPKPVIAMVNGAAAGAGCSVALACDFRIVTAKSKFVMSFSNVGLSGDTGGLYYLQRLVGTGKTMEMMMLAAPVGGEEAVQIGLATKLADEGALEKTANDFAHILANRPLVAIRHQKELLNRYFYNDLESYSKQEVAAMVDCSHSADFAEAVYAFLEKRKPVFQGK